MKKIGKRTPPRWIVWAYYNYTGSRTVLGEYRWWLTAFLRALWDGNMGWVAVKIERWPAKLDTASAEGEVVER